MVSVHRPPESIDPSPEPSSTPILSRHPPNQEESVFEADARTLSVTLVGSWPPLPAISAYCVALADALQKEVDLEVVTFDDPYPGWLYPGGAAPRDSTLTPQSALTARASLSWWNPITWWRSARESKGEVVHVQCWSLPLMPALAGLMACCRWLNKAVVLTIHNIADHEGRIGFQLGIRLLNRLADAVIVHSTRAPEWLRRGRGFHRLEHGPLGRPTGDWSVANAKRSFGWSPETPVALFFGAIRGYKGLDVLLEAFSDIRDRCPTARLLVAGRPWPSGEGDLALIERLGLADRVTADLRLIPSESVERWMTAADIVVLPYRHFESQSGVAMLSAGYGKPMIVSDVGELPKLFPDDPDAVVPAGDARALSKSLERALTDRAFRERLSAAARRAAQARSWSSIALQTKRLFRLALIDKGNGRIELRSGLRSDQRLPSTSWVIVTFNRLERLKQCLSSLATQEDIGQEWVIVDNGSTDGAAEWVRRHYPKATLVRLEANEGVSQGRNRGVERARGDVCLFLDDDATLAAPSATREIAELFASDDHLSAVALTIRQADTLQEEYKGIPRRDKRSLPTDYWCSYFCGAGFAVRRQAFLDAGGFWPPFSYGGQELDLSYRLLERGGTILHSRVSVLHHSAAESRPSGQWVYFNARDRWWIALRSLPWRHVVSTAILWWGYTFWVGVRRRELGPWWRGCWDGLIGCRQALRHRRVIGVRTVRAVKRLSGRLWC